jgi:predicted HicB family RNase H-like nuclease
MADTRGPEEPTAEETTAIDEGAAEGKTQREYSGKLMLRIPKELHKELAEAAKENGVSLNQYAAYKLAK